MFKNSKSKNTSETDRKNSLRLWPGIVIVVLQWLIRFGIPVIEPDGLMIAVSGGLFGGLAVFIWWIFFSRAPRFERWSAILLILITMVATFQILHVSIATANVGMMFGIFSIPVLSLAFVLWAVLTRNLNQSTRRITMVFTILFSIGFWALLRSEGMDGEIHHKLVWRWSKTAEERLLAKNKEITGLIITDTSVISKVAEWPGFRGPNRDAVVNGLKIKTDWSKNPPVEMWRKPIGPGCSSFAVHGNLLFTQEQRGEYEMVTCYNLNTGDPVWDHKDSTRFWDSHAGAGPRSTPTLSKGHVYTLGATGILNALNELDGSVIWSRNAASDTKVEIPGWGYTGSPLVTDSLVIVSVSGKLAVYHSFTGEPVWYGPDGGESYSSPHLISIDGVQQILFTSKTCASGFALADGKILWSIPWTGAPIIQPMQFTNSLVFLNEGNLKGLRQIEIKNASGSWTTHEKWISDKVKMNFNDFVIHKGYVFGFDGPYLSCIDSKTGESKWKGGRYSGQVLLLADQDLLLILSEKGDLFLVMAKPDKFTELAKFPVFKAKTWNHPVLAGNILIVRNSEEMAAFKLALF